MGFFFAFPLKSVCKILLEGLPVPYEISIAVFIFLSGLVSFVIAKVNQNIKGNVNKNCKYEFFYIMTLSMGTTTFFILGYPLLGLFFSGRVGIAKLGLQGILVDLFSRLLPQTMGMVGGEGGVPTNTGQSSTQQAECSGSRVGSNTDSASMAFVNNKLREQLAFWEESNAKIIKITKDFNNYPLSLALEIKGGEPHFLTVLEYQGRHLHNFIINRKLWLGTLVGRLFISPELTLAYESMGSKTDKLLEDYFNAVEKLSDKTDLKGCFKEYFYLTNGVRNAVYKELNAFENDLHSRVRRDPMYKNAEFKKILNQEYPALKKDWGGFILKKKNFWGIKCT